MSPSRAIVSPDAASWPEFAAGWIAARLAAVVAERGHAHLALAGGGTPRPVYERLAATPHREQIPWQQISVYFGDERCVPPDDAESNFRMARESLLDQVPLPAKQVFRMQGDRQDREAAAADYAACLPEALDLLLLGVGGDGHTASLFPGSALLTDCDRRVALVHGDKPPPWRLTITPPVIVSARQVAVLAHGRGKAEIVARALQGTHDPQQLPIQLAPSAVWILDPNAAATLNTHGVTNVES